MRVCEHCRNYLYPQGDCPGSYCSACQVVSYCSKTCQRADWAKHKAECAQLREEADAHRVPYRQVFGTDGRGGGSVTRSSSNPDRLVRAQCGLCGGRKPPFEVTPCCGRTVCSDQADYELMSYGRNSCARNHDRYSLCSTHFEARHPGPWQDCGVCKGNYEPYNWWTYGSNPENLPSRSNFPDAVLREPRPPMPRCVRCKRGVDTASEAHSFMPNCRQFSGLNCYECSELD